MGGFCAKGSKTTDPDRAPYGPSTAVNKGSEQPKHQQSIKSSSPVVVQAKPERNLAKVHDTPASKEPLKEGNQIQQTTEDHELSPRKRPPKKEYKYTAKTVFQVLQDSINEENPIEEPSVTKHAPDGSEVQPEIVDESGDFILNTEEEIILEKSPEKTVNSEMVDLSVDQRENDSHEKEDSSWRENSADKKGDQYRNEDKDHVVSSEEIRKGTSVENRYTESINTEEHKISNKTASGSESRTEHSRTSTWKESYGESSQKNHMTETSDQTGQTGQTGQTIMTSAVIESSTDRWPQQSHQPEHSMKNDTKTAVYTGKIEYSEQRSYGENAQNSGAHSETYRGEVQHDAHFSRGDNIANSSGRFGRGAAAPRAPASGAESRMAIFDAMRGMKSNKSTPATSPTGGASGKFSSLYNSEKSATFSDMMSQANESKFGDSNSNNISANNDSRPGFQNSYSQSGGGRDKNLSVASNTRAPVRLLI